MLTLRGTSNAGLGAYVRIARNFNGRCNMRAFSAAQLAQVEAKDLTISKGDDAAVVLEQASALVDTGRWRICNGGKGLERQLKFKSFKATWDFMNLVADECKKQKHHPEWTNIYNKTHIRWTTHNPEGLSSKDVHMAHFCDEAGQKFGELPPDPEDEAVGVSGKMKAGDCCGKAPKA